MKYRTITLKVQIKIYQALMSCHIYANFSTFPQPTVPAKHSKSKNSSLPRICTKVPTIRPKRTMNVLPVLTSLEDVCKLFGIAPSNCSCELFTMNGTSQFPDFCSFIDHKPTVLVYNSALSKSYASITIIASTFGSHW